MNGTDIKRPNYYEGQYLGGRIQAEVNIAFSVAEGDPIVDIQIRRELFQAFAIVAPASDEVADSWEGFPEFREATHDPIMALFGLNRPKAPDGKDHGIRGFETVTFQQDCGLRARAEAGCVVSVGQNGDVFGLEG